MTVFTNAVLKKIKSVPHLLRSIFTFKESPTIALVKHWFGRVVDRVKFSHYSLLAEKMSPSKLKSNIRKPLLDKAMIAWDIEGITTRIEINMDISLLIAYSCKGLFVTLLIICYNMTSAQ